MIGVVVSRADEASVAIGEALLGLADLSGSTDDSVPAGAGRTVHRTDGLELREFDGLHIHLEGAADPFPAIEALVFVSRHSGDTGPLLSVHFTGNFGGADFGGDDRTLARAAPNAAARALETLRTAAPPGYTVGMECTHHGPTDLDVPSLFVEVGSAEPQWRDPDAARAAARAVIALRGIPPDRERQLVGFGGGHYAPRFERIGRETGWAVGHVAADWCLEAMGAPDPDMLRQAMERSAADHAVLDGEHPGIASALRDLGYRVVGETWIRETDGVPLGLVDRLEDELRPVEAGLRFGAVARSGSGGRGTADADGDGLVIVSPDPALLVDVHGIDAAAARAAVAEHAVAFETADGGSRVDGRIALDGTGAIEPLLDGLIDVLERKYGAVERDGPALTVVERAFDPAAARDRGVPEGPAFGRLAAGEPVEVGDGTVRPEDVHTERTRRYAIEVE